MYFQSRVKEYMAYDWPDARNHCVSDDRRVKTRDGVVCYTDPATDEAYDLLTNAMDLPFGVIVELCQRRWEVPKV